MLCLTCYTKVPLIAIQKGCLKISICVAHAECLQGSGDITHWPMPFPWPWLKYTNQCSIVDCVVSLGVVNDHIKAIDNN
jgi:hypothetical protein